jgi:hypothetical protein
MKLSAFSRKNNPTPLTAMRTPPRAGPTNRTRLVNDELSAMFSEHITIRRVMLTASCWQRYRQYTGDEGEAHHIAEVGIDHRAIHAIRLGIDLVADASGEIGDFAQ